MKFRYWLQQKWFEHVEELQNYNQQIAYTSQEYFNKYKYWLKREFKHQQAESK